jgi:hypothetical protein
MDKELSHEVENRSMNETAMSKAMDAVHDEALKLLQHELPEEVQKGLELIVSIARYKFDVRGTQE